MSSWKNTHRGLPKDREEVLVAFDDKIVIATFDANRKGFHLKEDIAPVGRFVSKNTPKLEWMAFKLGEKVQNSN